MEAAFQTRLASAIEFAQRLIQVPTLDAEGTRRAARVVQAELDGLSLPYERIDVQGADGERFPTVLTWIGPQSSSPAVLFNAHLDTSPPTVEWTRDAYAGTIGEGRLWGRGATVAKSDVAAYIHGLAAARDTAGDAGTAVVAITSDEGFGGVAGPHFLLEQMGIRPVRAVTAGISRRVAYATNGAVQMRLRIRGRATHQSLIAPSEDAVRFAVALAAGISDLADELAAQGCSIPGIEHPTINVSRFAADAGFGMAPGTVEIDLDRRVTPDEDVDQVNAGLQAWLEAQAPPRGVAVEWKVVAAPEPLVPTPTAIAWAEHIAAIAAEVFGEPVGTGGLPLYTDARWFGTHGVPTALFGAGETDLVSAGINGADESVRLNDIDGAMRVVCRLAEAATTNQLPGV